MIFSYTNRKKAFTLAEILITLGVIGVVAAITMPVLITKYQKIQTVNKLKKVYTTLNQAMKLSEAENGEYVNWESGSDIGADAYFDKYWRPYFNVAKVCKTYADCGYSSNSPYVYFNGDYASTSIIVNNARVPFILADGTLVNIFVISGSSHGDIVNDSIYVDLNAGRGENKFGKDVFIFTRNTKGQIYANGYNKNVSDINEDCSNTGQGKFCAAKIIQDGWEIRDDYPW